MYKIIQYEEIYEKKVKDFITEIFIDEYEFEEYREYIKNENILKEYILNGGNFWIAVDYENNVIGTIGAKILDKKTLEIKRVYLKKEFRGHGISQKMYDILEDFAIKQDFEKLGIKVNFKAIEFNSLVNKIVNTADFDCIIIALTSNINEPNSGYNVWNPYGSLHLFNKRTANDLKSSDKILPFEQDLLDIFKKGALELNFAKRKEIYNKYQEIVADENPMVYLYAPLTIYAIRKKIKNVYPTKIGGLFHSMSEIYID